MDQSGITVISLFNGMSTGHLALTNLNIKVKKYYSSEVKKTALKITKHHFPNTIELGDIRNWNSWNIKWENIDLILSGSPCKDLSNAGKKEGLTGKNSKLFWYFIDILNHVKTLNPNVLFFQENVGSAPKKDIGIMSRAMGVYPIRINSSLVTAQLRDRYYWSNIRTKKEGLFGDIITNFPIPVDKKIQFKDIITSGFVYKSKSNTLMQRASVSAAYKDEKSKIAQTYFKKRAKRSMLPVVYYYLSDQIMLRLLNKTELCRLQGFPDNYCDILNRNQAADVLGDGWTYPIIEHFFHFLPFYKYAK